MLSVLKFPSAIPRPRSIAAFVIVIIIVFIPALGFEAEGAGAFVVLDYDLTKT
jgi:hypothetical protein